MLPLSAQNSKRRRFTPKQFSLACLAILSRRKTYEGGGQRAKACRFLPLTFLFLFLPNTLYLLIPYTSAAYAAATVTVAWDKNAETDVIGYKFHYGEYSHNYQYTVDVANNTSCSISGLAEGTTYYFAVTAYNDKDLESSYSEELAYTIPDVPAPTQEGLEAYFDSGQDGFSYAPDTFNNTAKPNFSTGSFEDNGGLAGSGGLRVFLGPGSTGGATSGGWSHIFSVDQDGTAQVTVSFRLIMDQGYETNEFGEVILEIDGVRHGNDMNNSLVHVTGDGNGGDIDDTGWLTESFSVPLSAGDDHELVIGAYNNNATYSDESVEVFIDDIIVVIIPDTPPPVDTYTIAASAEGCGTISPPGTATVNHGANQTYAMLPQDNCHIANVIVDGHSIGTPSTYTFANVTSSHTIVTDFAVNTHTITASAGANGTIFPAGNIPVAHNADQTFNITPDDNYHVTDIIVDGIAVGPSGSYTFSNVTGNHTVTAVFEIDTPEPPLLAHPVYTEPVQPVGSWLSGLNHAVEPGVKRVLVFTAHVEDNDGVPNLAGVTYGGQAMTKIIEQSVGSSTRVYVVAYILEEAGIAAVSNGVFMPAWTETPDKVTYSSIFFANVDQAAPVGRIDSNSTTSLSTLATDSLATAHGDLVFVAGSCGNSGNYSVNNDFTEGIELTMSSSDAVAGFKQATGTNELPSITHSRLNRQVVIGFVVQNDNK